MRFARRFAFVSAAVLVLTACGERLIFEASTDPTIAPTAVNGTDQSSDSSTEDGTATQAPAAEPGVINWETCTPGTTGPFECGYLDVPFDYDNPSVGTFSLYLVRRLADTSSSRIGSMLVNPGGPGFGGTDVAAYAEWYVSDALIERFDIVGWDPRGTGKSTPAVDCIDDYDRYFAIDSPPNEIGRAHV